VDVFDNEEEMYGGLRSTKNIPAVGKLYYWWFGRGAEIRERENGGSSGGSGSLIPTLEVPDIDIPAITIP
jgi:hypothetical protein